VKDLCVENCKSLMREIEEDLGRWKDLPHKWISRINVMRMTLLPKIIYMFNAILFKISIELSQR
jgi:hypothetical protein